MKKRIIYCLFLLPNFVLSSLLFSNLSFANEQISDPELKSVFDAFFDAIENKDKDQFLSLFHPQGVSWVGVYSDESIQILRERYGKDVFKPKAVPSSPEAFIDNIVTSPFEIKETFSDLKVFSDDNIASMHFNYIYFLGDFKSNWGQEGWQLIKTDDGWKINAVNFSMTYNTAPWPTPPKK